LVDLFFLLGFFLETVLNLVWLGVSVALLLVCGGQVMHAGKDRSRGMAAVAMVCLICLLFPVISMTDDLNSGSLVLLEPSKIKKILLLAHPLGLILTGLELRAPSEWQVSFTGNNPLQERRPSRDFIAFQLSRRPPPASCQI
jgi:hypothetical protein